MSIASDTHIRLDDRGVAWIDETNIKVIEVALEHIAHDSSTVESCDQHDGYLTMGQIHAALMHYFDHKAEYDEEIERQLSKADAQRPLLLIPQAAGDSARWVNSREREELDGCSSAKGTSIIGF